MVKALAGLMLFGAGLLSGPAWAAPSTFAPVIGSAVLCQDKIDPAYFFGYLNKAFGAPVRREGGAYWFKAGASLWGLPVPEAFVSDGSGRFDFVGVVVESKPDAVNDAIAKSQKIGAWPHRPLNAATAPVRESPVGGTIVYFGQKAKVYCARTNLARPVD